MLCDTDMCCHNKEIIILRIELENVLNMVANRKINTGLSPPFYFTSRRLSRLSCKNEYLAIDSGGNVSE